jgi:histone acetyltransferase HTATIP
LKSDEIGYYITQHPSTSSNGSPGTPERPLSDLGQKGYTAYWISVILRFCRKALSDAPPYLPPTQTQTDPPSKRASARRSIIIIRRDVTTTEIINGIEVTKIKTRTGQYSISLSLSDLAKACHLRIEDVSFTLHKLGFLQYRRQLPSRSDIDVDVEIVGEGMREEEEEGYRKPEQDVGEWINTEIVITRESVDREWVKWRVRPEGVLDESCVLL